MRRFLICLMSVALFPGLAYAAPKQTAPNTATVSLPRGGANCTLQIASRSLASVAQIGVMDRGLNWLPPTDTTVLDDAQMIPGGYYTVYLQPLGVGAASTDWEVHGIDPYGTPIIIGHNGTGAPYELTALFTDNGEPLWWSNPPEIVGWMRLKTVHAVAHIDPNATYCPAVSCRIYAYPKAINDLIPYAAARIKFSWQSRVGQYVYHTVAAWRAALLEPGWAGVFTSVDKLMVKIAAHGIAVTVDPSDPNYMTFYPYTKGTYTVANKTTLKGATTAQMNAINAWQDAMAVASGYADVIRVSLNRATGAYNAGNTAQAHAQIDYANQALANYVTAAQNDLTARNAVYTAFTARGSKTQNVGGTISLSDIHSVVDQLNQTPGLASYDSNQQLMGFNGQTLTGSWPLLATNPSVVAGLQTQLNDIRTPFCYGDEPGGCN